MSFETEFRTIELDQLHREAGLMKVDGWRFMQTHAVNTDNGVDLYYSFMKGSQVVNLHIAGVQKNQPVPSITDLFLAAFVFENEARELFGVDMRDIAIDFAGTLYAPAESEPMTFISPEQKAAKEKARKIAAAKAAKEAAKSEQGGADKATSSAAGFVMTPERQAKLDAKLATMSPEKVAKVQAALKARKAEQANSADAQKSASSPEKAAQKQETKPTQENVPKVVEASLATQAADEQLESLLGLLDADKAAVVRKALSKKEGE